ncbi:MAG TPA: hypothetical protein VHU83_15945 [Bryobacteraceae bacterium]|nr:hypothetical protein [Bryobacteraceae bacterium]
MDQENKNRERVLARLGARELAPQELESVAGGFMTLTVPTFDPKTRSSDGDPTHGA